MTSTRPLWYWCVLGTVAMSLGWGLRGSIGGGSLGAMIPGAMIGLVLCLLLDRRSDAGLIAAFAAVGVGFGGTIMVLGTWLAWKYVNSPKLIYFSNLLDRPREELWAGLWLGGLLLVAWLRSPVPAWFALHGAIGGGIGFGVGASLQPMGKAVWAGMPLGWWKAMELVRARVGM